MRYIGSKDKIISFIDNSINDAVGNVDGATFGDLFCGTASVARRFKSMNTKLITNDYMAFSYAFQVAYIRNNTLPEFKILSHYYNFGGYKDIIEYLNDLSDLKGFFYKEYTPEGTKDGVFQRNYFSEENAIRIDSIRFKLSEWYTKKLINEDELHVLLASLIDATTKISNTSGTYGAFLKIDDFRKFRKLNLQPIEIIENPNKHVCFCEDIFEVVKHVEGDILYLDPPYNSRQYPPYYHILETIALNDNPKIYGKTGRRPYQDKLSSFCVKNKAGEALESIIKDANFKHIFLSYSNEGLVPIDELVKRLEPLGLIEVYEEEYRRYKSNSNGEDKNKQLKEIIFYVRK